MVTTLMERPQPNAKPGADDLKLPKGNGRRRSAGKEWERDAESRLTTQAVITLLVVAGILLVGFVFLSKGCQSPGSV